MNRVPRASLAVTLLQDEDFGALISARGGMEAFGFFVAIVIAGRERLQQDRATRVGETDALRFDDSTAHILKMVHSSKRQFDKCLSSFESLAKLTGAKPWLYLDKDNHIVIRSFFKWNTVTGWGGARDRSGRKSSCNQDGPRTENQDEIKMVADREPSWCASGSGTGTNITPLPPEGGGVVEDVPPVPEKPTATPPRAPTVAEEEFAALGEHADTIRVVTGWAQTLLVKTDDKGVPHDRGQLEDFYPNIQGWVNAGYRRDWIEDAIQMAATSAAHGKLARYVTSCLLRWRREGRKVEPWNSDGKPRPEPPQPEVCQAPATSRWAKQSRKAFEQMAEASA